MKTPIQTLEEYLLDTDDSKISDKFFNNQLRPLLIDLREKERLIINKAHADGVMWGLQAVTGNKVSETNYYEEKYGTSRDNK